ncbi:hypothetical protein, conserved [Eimeria brunetti]|uniref:Uncharacterized protein n=1 Tax=Eimeria brunetti TaxID=51314 RepID=U6LNW9_9EIME|nr:hypothetical protein, conserved [Eimeria brunetti]
MAGAGATSYAAAGGAFGPGSAAAGSGAAAGAAAAAAAAAAGRSSFQKLLLFAARFKYRNLSPQFVAAVIKTGTFCRTMWPLFPPLMLLQYIKQTDAEMFSIEQLKAAADKAAAAAAADASPSSEDAAAATAATAAAAAAAAAPVFSFLDLRKSGWTGHWRLQQDLALIHHRVNKTENEEAAAAAASSSSSSSSSRSSKDGK